MKNIAAISILGLCISTTSQAAITDDNADVIHVRKNCSNVSNCVNTMAEALTWTWNTRNPSATSPLLIQVGPGDFGRFYCDSDPLEPKGYLTLRGSGVETTRLVSQPGQGDLVHSNGCTDMTFENMSIVMSHTDGATSYAIRWLEGGNSVWSNVLVENNNPSFVFRSGTWYESGCVFGGTGKPGKHYWYSSKLSTRVRSGMHTFGYANQCQTESWFYGTEIEVIADGQTTQAVNTVTGIELANSVNQLFGSAIRVYVDPANPSNQTFDRFAGVAPQTFDQTSDGAFHMHGGVISVNASASLAPVAVNGVYNIATNHNSGVAYVVKSSQGQTAQRVTAGARSQFTWPPADQPPAISSITGGDMFVETDCDSSGYCEADGNQAHLMIYNDTECTASPWFDTRTNSCRLTGSNPNP